MNTARERVQELDQEQWGAKRHEYCTGPGAGSGPGIMEAKRHEYCTEPGAGTGPGTMGYYILCRTVHTVPEPGTGSDPLSPIVPVPLPMPVLFPFPRH